MAEKVVSVRLQARVEGFTAGMRKAKASVDDLTKADVPKAARGYKDLADKAALAGAAIGVGLGVAVKRFADFDEAMSAVAANSGAAATELEALRQAALTLGADSQFSATEAAQGINELSKAGVKTADILGGGLKGALDLAAAGQISVADAAESTASALGQFGLKGDKATHVADLLSNAASSAQGGVGDMAAALANAGVSAKAAGLNIDETTTILALFAKSGLVGAEAGTQLKTMMTRLSAPSDEAKAKMDELGIVAYDLAGNFVGAEVVMGQMAEATKGMGDAQRSAAFNTIFGSFAIQGAGIAAAAGAEGYAAMNEEVTKLGGAQEQARRLTDNFKGDLERLGGAFDSVLIETGSGANSSLRTLTQGLTGLVEQVGKVPGPVLLAAAGLAAIALTVPRGIIAVREYAARLESLGVNFDKAGGSASAAARNFTIAGTALAAAAAATAAFDKAGDSIADKFGSITVGVEDATSKIIDASSATDDFTEVIGRTQGRVAQFGGYLEKVSPVANVFGGDMENARESVANYDQALAGLVSSGNGEAAADFLKRAGINATEAADVLPGYTATVKDADNAQKIAAGSGSQLTDATADLAVTAEDAEKALSDLKSAIDGLGSPVAQQRAAERDFQAAVDDATAAIEENGRTLDANTEKGRANQASLDEIRTATLEKVKADFEATGSTEAAAAAMETGRKAFIDAAVAAGSTKKEAALLADQLGLIPSDVNILVRQTGAEAAGAAITRAAQDQYSTIWVARRFRTTDLDPTYNSNPGRWMGGAIYGPGSGTSDTAGLFRLSNGEHVLTAAEVKAAGGQSAVYALRAALRQGKFPGLAGGGAVTPQYAPPTQYVQMSGGPSIRTERYDQPINIGQLVTPDVDSFRRQAERERAASYAANRRAS